MPKFTYSCLSCNHTFDSIELIANRNQPQTCPECGNEALRNIEAELSGAVVGDAGDRIRYSDALGCVESQIDDFQKLHPGAEFRKSGSGYQMVIHNRREKMKRLRERGLVEFDPRKDC